MDKRFFTILFLSSHLSKGKKFVVPEFLVKSLAVSALVLIVASAIVFYDYVRVKKKEIDLTSLEEKTQVQDVQLKSFADKITDMEAELARLRTLDSQIRVLTNKKIEKIEIPRAKSRNISLGGRGGPEKMSLSFDNRDSLKEMTARLEKLNAEARDREKSLNELHASLEDQRLRKAATPSFWPVRGYISSSFGERESPFRENTEFHEGIDISASMGAPVIAAADGIVSRAGRYYDFGNAVTIDHGYGFVSRYGHLSEITVHPGQRIKKGQKIGRVGNTGRSTGPHLHYEVAVNGSKVDPLRYLD